MKTTFRPICIAIAASLAACGGSAPDAVDAADEVVQCSWSMPARSSALEIHRAIEAVLQGAIDPCGGAVSLQAATARFVRIDQDELEPRLHLIFQILSNSGPPRLMK
jgi:hypothetical protein